MSFTEKYRPTKRDDLIGNSKQVAQINALITSYCRGGYDTPRILVHGEAGIGKTTAVRIIAAENKLKLVESNSSSERKKDALRTILTTCKLHHNPKILVFLDEADGIMAWGTINEIIKSTKYPLVLAANSVYKIPANIREKLTEVRFYPPTLQDIVKLIKKIQDTEKITSLDYSKITRDVRSSINAVFNNAEKKTKDLNPFEAIEQLVLYRSLDAYSHKEHCLWFMDNIDKLYSGFDKVTAFQALSLVDLTGYTDFLELLPKSSVTSTSELIEYPNFLRRAAALKEKKNEPTS